MARQTEEGLLGSGGNSKFTVNIQPSASLNAIGARLTVAMMGLAVAVLRAKSVVRRMESGRKPERAVRMSRATPVSTGWYTDLHWLEREGDPHMK